MDVLTERGLTRCTCIDGVYCVRQGMTRGGEGAGVRERG